MAVERENAKIRKAWIGYEDHGILTSFLELEYDHAGQGFGGYGLGGPYLASWVEGVLKTLELERWDELPGTIVRVDREHVKVHRIGHAYKDRWFDPKATFEAIERGEHVTAARGPRRGAP